MNLNNFKVQIRTISDFTEEECSLFTPYLQTKTFQKGDFPDQEFRQQQFQLAVDNISSFAPYNTIRITQHYQYEAGILEETVELFKLEGKTEIPFVKIEEKAFIFRPTSLEGAPTSFAR